jgi:hypothetical protein
LGNGLTADKMHVEQTATGAMITFEGNETDRITIDFAGQVNHRSLTVTFEDGTSQSITGLRPTSTIDPSFVAANSKRHSYSKF